MLILKGDCGKSRVAEILMNATTSICFVYDDYFPFVFNAINSDCREYSLNDFLECISDTLEEAVINNNRYDYLFIYTNQDEENLQDIINWLNEYRYNVPCRDIVLTCK